MGVTGLFSDSFDYLASAQLTSRWSGIGSNTTVVATGGRRNTGYLSFASGGLIYENIPNSQDVIVQAAVKFASAPSANYQGFMSLWDTSTVQTDVRLYSTGQLYLTRNGTTLDISTKTITDFSSFHFVELIVHIEGGTSGWAIVRVDGVEWLNLSGINTQATANAYATKVQLALPASASSPATQFDDVLIRWGSGLSASYLTGDTGTTYVAPTSDNANDGWTASTGSDHYAMVDDATPDDATTYEYTTAGTALVSFGMGSVSTTATIRAVEPILRAYKLDAGTRYAIPYCVISGGTYWGGSATLTDSYAYYSHAWGTSPATGTAWTAAEVNAAKFGFKVIG